MKIEQNPRYASLAARAVARAADDDAATPGPELPDRTAAIAAIDRALRARGRRRVGPWLGWGVAAAAAAVLLAVGWRGLQVPAPVATAGRPGDAPATTAPGITAVESLGASIESATGTRLAAADDRIAPGSRVKVDRSGRLLLALDSGTRLRFAGSSRARVSELGALQRFDLESGTMEADVAKLASGSRFVIATTDAEVEVKGTRFEVALATEASSCAPFVRTRVVVHEGVVAVRFGSGEVHVPAGSAWPACPPPRVSPAPPARARTARTPVTPAAAATPPAPAVDPSTLAEQNDLFAAALAARRRGDVGEAVHWFDRLITRHPDGPLTESARAERRRLIEAGGGGSAPAQ